MSYTNKICHRKNDVTCLGTLFFDLMFLYNLTDKMLCPALIFL